MGLTNTPLFKNFAKIHKHCESLIHSASKSLEEIAVEGSRSILTGKKKTCPSQNEQGDINRFLLQCIASVFSMLFACWIIL